MRSSTLTFLFLALVLVGCSKDAIEVDELNTNPFDVDYTGDPVFSTIEVRTVPFLLNGELIDILEVDVQVNRALFPIPTSYTVTYRLPTGQTNDVPSSELSDDRFTRTALNVIAGQQYCFEPRLGNNGGLGSGATLCGTAE